MREINKENIINNKKVKYKLKNIININKKYKKFYIFNYSQTLWAYKPT